MDEVNERGNRGWVEERSDGELGRKKKLGQRHFPSFSPHTLSAELWRNCFTHVSHFYTTFMIIFQNQW